MEGGEKVREAFRKFRAGEPLNDQEKSIVNGCREGTLKYYLKKWTPDSSDEDISNLIASGFDWDALWDQRYVSCFMLLASFLNTNCNQLLT